MACKKNCDLCNRRLQFSTERSIIRKYGLPMPVLLMTDAEKAALQTATSI